jgi:hypothetical protein
VVEVVLIVNKGPCSAQGRGGDSHASPGKDPSFYHISDSASFNQSQFHVVHKI